MELNADWHVKWNLYLTISLIELFNVPGRVEMEKFDSHLRPQRLDLSPKKEEEED